mmetsp:Transcript_59220/g.162474  ORF Transcript_59220/g.162474 Transcript_59220/m.162474 type:complete len:123 (-) Transcript_59220:414-782(-)
MWRFGRRTQCATTLSSPMDCSGRHTIVMIRRSTAGRTTILIWTTAALPRPRRGVGGDVTTRARAEGAIEGTLDDYRVRSDFGTAFRFSRFDSSAALVRNVSALGGNIGAKHEHAHPGREAGR